MRPSWRVFSMVLWNFGKRSNRNFDPTHPAAAVAVYRLSTYSGPSRWGFHQPRSNLMSEISVKVTKFKDRKFWLMYYDDPLTGKRPTRSTKETTEAGARKAAGKWEA